MKAIIGVEQEPRVQFTIEVEDHDGMPDVIELADGTGKPSAAPRSEKSGTAKSASGGPRNPEDARADAKALWPLSEHYLPTDVRESAKRWGMEQTISEMWRNAFIAGWRAAHRR